jgi:hypothetical protein
MTARAMFTTPAAHLFSGDRGRTCMNSIGLVFSPTGARDGCAYPCRTAAVSLFDACTFLRLRATPQSKPGRSSGTHFVH